MLHQRQATRFTGKAVIVKTKKMKLHFSLFILCYVYRPDNLVPLLTQRSPISAENYVKYLIKRTTGGRLSGMKMEGSHLKPRLFLLFFRLKTWLVSPILYTKKSWSVPTRCMHPTLLSVTRSENTFVRNHISWKEIFKTAISSH